MKKRTKVILGIGVPFVLLTGGIIITQSLFDIFLAQNFAKKAEEASREGQLAWLKAHERKTTEFIHQKCPKITSVQYDWESMQVGTVGNGLPQGGGDVLTIDGRFNEIKDSRLIVSFALESKNSLPTMNDIYSDQSLSI